MGDWLSWHTFIAFALGVLLSGLVMALVQQLRNRAGV